MVLGIGHHDDDTFVVVVPLTGGPTSQREHRLDSFVDIVDGKVQMHPDLALLSLVDGLEHETRQNIASVTQVDPVAMGGPGSAVEQSAPEPSDTLDVNTVNCHT